MKHVNLVSVYYVVSFCTLTLSFINVIELPLVIKQSVWIIFIDLRKPHPSLHKWARDINGTVLYLANPTKKWFHKRWENKYEDLIERY